METKTYLIELINTDDGETSLYEVKTTLSLENFEKTYEEIRQHWYEDEENLPCLIDYLLGELNKKGIDMFEIGADLSLDF